MSYHLPDPVAVATPSLLSSSPIALYVMPAALELLRIVRIRSAFASDFAFTAAWRTSASGLVPPSFTPPAFASANAALVLNEMNKRSCQASAA